MTWTREYAELAEMLAAVRLAMAHCTPFLPVDSDEMAAAELAAGRVDRSCQRWIALRAKGK